MFSPDTQQLSWRRGLQALFPMGRVQAAGWDPFPPNPRGTGGGEGDSWV